MSNSAVINRSLTSLRNELEFLRDSGVITDAFYNDLDHKLPRKHDPGAAPLDVSSSDREYLQASQSYQGAPPPSGQPPPRPSSSPGREVAEALYEYQGRDPSDLSLYKGQRIFILEKVNQDWWKGRDMNSGSEGLFPSNYVRVDPSLSHLTPPPPQYSEKRGYGQDQYQPPPPQQQQYQQGQYMPPTSPAPYPPPSTGYYQPQQQAPPPQQVVVAADQPHEQSTMRKFGSKLGNAAIFGAGATIGSDLVNSIF